MGDLISRQAALETIRTMQTYKLFAGDDMLLIDQAKAQTELMMLPSAEPERKEQWIPVAEKLPLPQTLVWTTDIDGDVSMCKLSHSGNEWYGENDGRIYLRGSVVAWMPYNVPEPYQEGGE